MRSPYSSQAQVVPPQGGGYLRAPVAQNQVPRSITPSMMYRPQPVANIPPMQDTMVASPSTTSSRRRTSEKKSTGVSSVCSKVSYKKRRLADRTLSSRIIELVPESQAYMELLALEKKLDQTIMRKRLDIQEALKRPIKLKKKLRVFITTHLNAPEGKEGEEKPIPQWEMRVEGRLVDDLNQKQQRRKFSSFFKSLVIELDRDLYGPDNHLVEWHRTRDTDETDGYQVKRPCDENVQCRCTILLMLDHQPAQFKLDPRLARLLGIHTSSRPVIIEHFWQYVKNNKLQDSEERDFINCDKYMMQLFQCERMKFYEIPSRLSSFLYPPDPIVIHHMIDVSGPEKKKTRIYDVEVEVDDSIRDQMKNFLLSSASQNEIQNLDNKIFETIEQINNLKGNREFFMNFADNPKEFINQVLASQCKDLKLMTDQTGNPEEERRADHYDQGWIQEAVCRYMYSQLVEKRAEIEQALRIR